MRDASYAQTPPCIVNGEFCVEVAVRRKLVAEALERPADGLVDMILRRALIDLDDRLEAEQALAHRLVVREGLEWRLRAGLAHLARIAADGARPLSVSEFNEMRRED